VRRKGYAAEAATSGRGCLEQVSEGPVDVVVTDVLMPDMSGLDLCQALRTSHPEVLTIMLTGRAGLDVAVSAIRAGAYLTKPVGVAVLEVSILRALAHVELRRELMRLREVVDHRASNEIAGESSAIPLATRPRPRGCSASIDVRSTDDSARSERPEQLIPGCTR